MFNQDLDAKYQRRRKERERIERGKGKDMHVVSFAIVFEMKKTAVHRDAAIPLYG